MSSIASPQLPVVSKTAPRSNSSDTRAARAAIDATSVVAAFNTWSFKREQPDTPQKLINAVAKVMARSQPVSFVLYWGKGPRNHVTNHEAQTLDYLASMTARIDAIYPPGASTTLILTDTHARLNGHSNSALEQYFSGVSSLALTRGNSNVRLSTLVDRYSGAVASEPLTDVLRASLVRSAEKWHFGGLTPEVAARTYFDANMRERQAVESAMPNSIFLTYNGSDMRALFPKNLPIFYMYALKRGVAVKPWFMP